MLPDDLHALLVLHRHAAPTGSGLNPRLLALLEARAAEAAAAPQPDAALPAPRGLAGTIPRADAGRTLEAIASGEVAAFPGAHRAIHGRAMAKA